MPVEAADGHDRRMVAAASTTRRKLMERRERLLPLGAALVTVVLWASAFVGIRAAGNDLSPGSLALGRLLIGSLVLGALALARHQQRPPKRVAPGIVLCGLLWFAAYNVALNAAEQRVDAGTAAMLVNVGPILIAILAGLVLREGFPRRLFFGCAVAFAGVTIIGLASAGTGPSAGTGALLCLLAAGAYSGGMIIQKGVLRSVSALQTTFLCCLVGAAACLPFAPRLIDELGLAPASTIAWLIYLGAFPTAIAFTTWAYALARTDAGLLGVSTYLAPPIAIMLGWAALGEVPATLAFLGGALCVAGVAISRR
jgi:drug/metabolite transporter (DMT)-like permease